MIGRGRIRVLPAALAGLLLAAAAARADDVVNFDFYPEGARDCLYQAATSSKCEASTVAATNNCFCRNGGDFVMTAAACIGQASPNDVEKTFNTMRDACKGSQTPLTISKADFLEAAESGASTTTTQKPTTTSQTSTATSTDPTTTTTGTNTATTTSSSSSSTPTNGGGNNNNSNTGISTGALAGTVVGGVVGLALVAVLAYFLFRRGRRVGEESHPMLPQHHHQAQFHPERHSAAPTMAASTTLSGGRESTAYYGSPPPPGEAWGAAAAAAAKKGDYGGSPDPRVSGIAGAGGSFNWESASHLAYGGAPSPPPVPIQELEGAQHFPTGSPGAPAEMGGGVTPVVATAPPVTLPGSPPQPAQAGPQLYQAYNPGQQQQQQMGQMGQYQQQQQLYPGQPQYPGQQYPGGGGGAAGWGQQQGGR